MAARETDVASQDVPTAQVIDQLVTVLPRALKLAGTVPGAREPLVRPGEQWSRLAA